MYSIRSYSFWSAVNECVIEILIASNDLFFFFSNSRVSENIELSPADTVNGQWNRFEHRVYFINEFYKREISRISSRPSCKTACMNNLFSYALWSTSSFKRYRFVSVSLACIPRHEVQCQIRNGFGSSMIPVPERLTTIATFRMYFKNKALTFASCDVNFGAEYAGTPACRITWLSEISV